MKRKLLLKSLLVAVGLLVGGNAWAATETYDFYSWLKSAGADINVFDFGSTATTVIGAESTSISCYAITSDINGNSLNQRFALSNTHRNSGKRDQVWFRNNSQARYTGLFVAVNRSTYFSILDLLEGDKVTITFSNYSNGTLFYSSNATYEVSGVATTIVSGTTAPESGTTYTMAADGHLDIYLPAYSCIGKVVIESSSAETMGKPSISAISANGGARTVQITPGTGSGGSQATATYYTTDESEPSSSNGTLYDGTFVITQTTTIKAVSYLGTVAGEVVSSQIEAGTTITLNAPTLSIRTMQPFVDGYAPVYRVSIDNSNLIGSPTATITATFDGNDVSSELLAGDFLPSTDGFLTVEVSATGYETNSINTYVYSTYNETYASTDYSTLTSAEAVEGVLGANWTSTTTRWANWNKTNSIYGDQYVIYSSDATSGNIYIDKDNMLRAGYNIQFVESFGFGRNVTGSTTVFINNTGTPQDITLYRVINSKGANTNTYADSYVKSVYNEGKSYSQFDIPGGETFCQAIIYSPVHTYGIVGDLTGNWTNDVEMTQSTTDNNVYTLVVEHFEATAGKYEYKLRADGQWGVYDLPATGNQEYEFTNAGVYKLTFTANIKENTLTLDVEENPYYTVAGCYNFENIDFDSFFGTAWAPTETANNMTLNADGIYELKFTDVVLDTPGIIRYKVVKNNSWANSSYPSDDATWGVNEAGTYDITFTFNPTTKDVACNVAIKKEISEAGYATYYSSYGLDFAAAGLEAYIAKLNGTTVEFNKIDDAPSNTGVLLKGAKGTYKLPVIVSTTDVTDNAFFGVLEDTKVAGGIFVLMNGGQGVGFYKTTAEFTVGANTAYLPATAAHARDFIGFGDDTTTSINAISNEKMNGEVYNLNGQRVVAPAKGLYIVNGKKVVLK